MALVLKMIQNVQEVEIIFSNDPTLNTPFEYRYLKSPVRLPTIRSLILAMCKVHDAVIIVNA